MDKFHAVNEQKLTNSKLECDPIMGTSSGRTRRKLRQDGEKEIGNSVCQQGCEQDVFGQDGQKGNGKALTRRDATQDVTGQDGRKDSTKRWARNALKPLTAKEWTMPTGQ